MSTRSGFRIAALALVTAAAKNKNLVEGNVVTAQSRCLPQRIVKLYSPTGVLEASMTTDALGAFKFMTKDLPVGIHTVNVQKRVYRKSRRHTHRCASAQTTFTVS